MFIAQNRGIASVHKTKNEKKNCAHAQFFFSFFVFNLQRYPPVNPADGQRREKRKGADYLMKKEKRFL